MMANRWTLRTVKLGLALAAALCAGSAQADSAAHNGWQCTARTDSISVYYWLKAPQAEAGVSITDNNTTSELLDTSFRYSASPSNQYFTFKVKLGTDHRIVRNNTRIMPQGLKVEVSDGTKVLASGNLTVSRDFDVSNAEAVPLIGAMGNPATKDLVVRLLDGAGQPLARYTVPMVGFMGAMQAAGAMMGQPGSESIGKSCT